MFRKLTGKWQATAFSIAIAYSVFQIFMTLGLIRLNPMSFRAVHLVFALVLGFLLYPVKSIAESQSLDPNQGEVASKNDTVPWFDALFALICVGIGAYLFAFVEINPETLIYRIGGPISNFQEIMGMVFIVLILEGTRRAIGLPLPIIIVISLIYAKYANLMPGVLASRGQSVEQIVSYSFLSGNGIFGSVLGISASYVFIFILFSTFFQYSGVGKMIIDLAMGLLGTARGGPAKIAIVASGFFGTISGSAVANIMTTGAFTIPMMKRIGLSPRFAGAVEAVASTGGMFMPPFLGAAAFIMADYLNVPYGVILKAALIPALLYYITLYFVIDMEAQKLNLKGLPRNELPDVRKVFIEGAHLLLPLVLLIYLLVFKNYSAQKAALYGIVAIWVVTLFRANSRMSFKTVVKCLELGAKHAVQIAVSSGAIAILVGVVELTGLGVRLTGFLVDLSNGSLMILLVLSAVASIILGLGLTPAAVYITLAILVTPSLINMGVEPLAAHMFVFIFGIIGMITPPVAISAYVAGALAGANVFATGMTAWRLGLSAFIIPFMFVYGPELLMIGQPLDIIRVFVTSVIGVWALAGSLQGVLLVRANILERIGLFAAALLLINTKGLTDIIGIVVIALVIASQLYKKKIVARKGSSDLIIEI